MACEIQLIYKPYFFYRKNVHFLYKVCIIIVYGFCVFGQVCIGRVLRQHMQRESTRSRRDEKTSACKPIIPRLFPSQNLISSDQTWHRFWRSTQRLPATGSPFWGSVSVFARFCTENRQGGHCNQDVASITRHLNACSNKGSQEHFDSERTACRVGKRKKYKALGLWWISHSTTPALTTVIVRLSTSQKFPSKAWTDY